MQGCAIKLHTICAGYVAISYLQFSVFVYLFVFVSVLYFIVYVFKPSWSVYRCPIGAF